VSAPTSITSTTPVVLTNTSTVDADGPFRLRVSALSTLSVVTGFFASPGVPDPSITVVDDSDPRNVLIEIAGPLAAGDSLTFWVELTQSNRFPAICPGGYDDGQPFRVELLDSTGATVASAQDVPPATCEF